MIQSSEVQVTTLRLGNDSQPDLNKPDHKEIKLANKITEESERKKSTQRIT